MTDVVEPTEEAVVVPEVVTQEVGASKEAPVAEQE